MCHFTLGARTVWCSCNALEMLGCNIVQLLGNLTELFIILVILVLSSPIQRYFLQLDQYYAQNPYLLNNYVHLLILCDIRFS
jgi:hypothetical protein